MQDSDRPSEATDLDPVWYAATFPDAVLLGMTPEEHYRQIGRALGRPAGPPSSLVPEGDRWLSELLAALPPPGPVVPEPALAPESFPIVEVPPEAMDPGPAGPLPDGGTGAFTFRSGEARVGRFADGASMALHWPRMALLARIEGRLPAEAFGVEARAGREVPALPLDPGPAEIAGPCLRDGPGHLIDAWFASSSVLALAFAPGEGEASGVVAYQSTPWTEGSLSEVGGGPLARGGETILRLDLLDPLRPVLVELRGADGLTLDTGLLPFPSLVRGGMHHAELVAAIDGQEPSATLWSYGQACVEQMEQPTDSTRAMSRRIRVRLAEATGREPILRRAMTAWLGRMGHSVAVLGLQQAVDGRLRAEDPAEDGPILVLPGDAIPTVAALCGGALVPGEGGGNRLAPHLVAEIGSGRPLWSVIPPSELADLVDLQPSFGSFPILVGGPVEAMGGAAGVPRGLPLAIRLIERGTADPIRALMPSPPGSAALSRAASVPETVALLTATDPGRARATIASLLAQTGSERVRLIVTGPPAVLDALAPDLSPNHLPGAHWEGRVRSAPAALRDATALLECSEGAEALLLLDDRVVLHDPRTLGVLGTLLASGRTASAACAIVSETVAGKARTFRLESCGLFPTRLGLVGGPHLVCERLEAGNALPDATYPVIANVLAAALLSRAALAEARLRLRPGRPLDELAFGLAALDLGWRHLCTTVVRAGSLEPLGPPERADPLGLAQLPVGRWAGVVDGVTLLAELR